MKLVIVGTGKVGGTLIENFLDENHDIVVMDVNAEVVTDAVNRFDVKGVVGSGLERNALNDAEVEAADFFIACTSRDEVNILSCVLAKKLGAKRTIARVRDPEYFREMGSMKEVLGLDFAFNPELNTAIEISRMLRFPSARNVESFVSDRAIMAEFEITDGNPIINKSLKEIAEQYGKKVLISVVQRGKECFIPNGDFIIRQGDFVHFISTESEINSFLRKMNYYKRRAKDVFVIGGGKIAYYLAKEAEKYGISVKIVESKHDRANLLASALPEATVICGDGTDHQILDEENLKGADACVTLTGMDEENVIVSLYAKQNGVSKVITKIDRLSIVNMVGVLGLSTVVSPKDIIANQIVSFVRAHQAETGSGINTLYKLYDKVEALEFTVSDNFTKVDETLRSLNLKKNVLIGGIVRDNEFILPSGNTKICAGDRVIVVTASKQINDLTQIFE